MSLLYMLERVKIKLLGTTETFSQCSVRHINMNSDPSTHKNDTEGGTYWQYQHWGGFISQTA